MLFCYCSFGFVDVDSVRTCFLPSVRLALLPCVDLNIILHNLGISWVSLGHHLDIIWDHLCIIWVSFGHRLGIIWASFEHHLGIIAGDVRNLSCKRTNDGSITSELAIERACVQSIKNSTKSANDRANEQSSERASDAITLGHRPPADMKPILFILPKQKM